jgi:predicted TIM-barrel fold metal-dependent hydrolase
MVTPMRITDAQVHVWAESTPERPWPSDGVPPQRVPALGPGELLEHMNRAGVARAVLIPPTWEGSRNDLALAAAAAHPDRFAVMGRLDWTDPTKVAEVPGWRSTSGMLGIRMSMNRGDVEGLIRAGVDTGFFAAAEAHQVPVTVYMPGRHGDLQRIAEAYPELRITVDHLAIESADRPLDVAIKPLLPLAALPNVAVKASAMPCFVTEQFPFPSIAGAVHQLVDAFGAERVFWGSDLSRLPCSYEQLVEVFTQHMPRLTGDQLRLVMGDGIAAWLGWPD